MKKLLVITVLATIGINLYAQPIFTAENSFQANDSSRLGFAVYAQSFENIAAQKGNGTTWDFSAAAWAKPTVEYKFQPSKESIHTSFHNTEINEYGLVLFARDLFFSYSPKKDTLFYEGMYASANYVAAPRFPYLTFPLTFGDSVFVRTVQYGIPSQPKTATGSVTRYWIYDGYGKVKLPYGTVENVYRIRTRQIDSTYVLKMGTVYDEIIWFSKASGIPVLRFLKNGNLISAYYASASGTTTGLGKVEESLNMRYNKQSKVLSIDNSGNLKGTTYQVADINGRKAMIGRVVSEKATIDLSPLHKGLYLISFDNSKLKPLRIMVD